MGYFANMGFEKSTKVAKKRNEETLLTILKTNEDSVYGMEKKFSEMKCKKDFIERIPLNRYENLQKYIDDMIQGEQNTLFGKKLKLKMVNNFFFILVILIKFFMFEDWHHFR